MTQRTYEPLVSASYRPKRTDTPEGFLFLTPPLWFYVLHPNRARARMKFGILAYIAYTLKHHPERVRNVRLTRWQVNHYLLYRPILGMCNIGKFFAREWLGILLLLAIFGVPFLMGLLVGLAHHITIEAH